MYRRRFLAAAVTGVLGGAGGCVAVPTSADEARGESLLRDAIETRIGLTDLSGRRVLTAEIPTETTRRVERVSRRPPGERRTEILESNDSQTPPGFVAVTNRTTTWEVDPTADRVVERHHPNRVVVDGPKLALETLLEAYAFTFEETDTVDGREAHRIDAEPIADDLERSLDLLVGETVYRIPLERTESDELDDATVTRSVWIDDEYRYPIQERDVLRGADGDLLHRLTVTYEDLEIDAGLEDETFTYDPPADADVERLGTEPTGSYDARAEAADDVPYDLPEPSVPDPYVLDRITVVDNSPDLGIRTTFWYHDPARPERELFVAVRDERRHNPDVLEEIDLDGHTAYRREGGIDSVFWSCEGLHYEVSSSTVAEPVRDIAASIGCT